MDSLSGKLTQSWCDNARYMPFIKGSEPRETSGCVPDGEKAWSWFKGIFD
ncbi:hypothetical protein [Spongiibacter sp. IMCC21906]|nr:hypothetical protein [Spongiibacter sp. IMCC21906]